MSDLAMKHCVPCRGDVPPLSADGIRPLQAQLPRWDVVHGQRLARPFAFRDFKTALGFVDRIGAVAEEEGHHPDLHLSYGQVRVEIWTHAAGGLTESDFILAAKVDEVAETAPGRV
jgi:4a-hydroxytetrahydrobiopterin dehydratase